MKYQIYIDDNFHYMNEDERVKGPLLRSKEAAIAEVKQIVDESLLWERNQCENPNDPKELYERYIAFGDDPFILSEDKSFRFSAWEYAKLRSAELCWKGEARF